MAGNDKKYSSEDQAARTRSAEVGRGKSTENAINIKNPKSSAKGPYQILDSTWKDMERMAGKKLDRKNPEDNELAFQLYTNRSEKTLEQNGIEVNPGNTYALHVYGPKGGVDFLKKIKANPEGLAIDGMSKEVINGNKAFFFDEKGRPRTNAGSYNTLSSRVGGPQDPGAITLAKNIERQQVQEQQNALAQQEAMQQQARTEQQEPEQQQEEQPQEQVQEEQAVEQQIDETSQLSRASNQAKIVYSGDRTRDDKFILPTEPVQEDIKTSGESVQKMKTFAFGGITESRKKKITPEQQAAGEARVKELGAVTTEKPFENKETFNTKKIVKYQPGVLSGNDNGFYLYSKDPTEGGFNPEKDREFVKQSEMMSVQRTPEWSEYLKQVAAKNAGNRVISSLSTEKQFAHGGDISLSGKNDGILNEFNEGGSHEENPNGGILQGVSKDGSSNTVEEGETKMGNYVFSNRLSLEKKDVENLYLPRETEGMTYAEASKFINSFLEENPFDYIIKRTVTSQLESLKVGNDRARRYKENEENLLVENEVKKEIKDNPEIQEENAQQGEFALGGYFGIKKYVNGGTTLTPAATTAAVVGAASAGLGMGMEAFKTFDTGDVNAEDIQKVGVGGAIAKGTVSGAAAGMAFGPWGAAIGGVIGGGLGAIGASRQNKAANKQDINKSDYNFNMLAREDESIAKYGGMQRKYDSGGNVDVPNKKQREFPSFIMSDPYYQPVNKFDQDFSKYSGSFLSKEIKAPEIKPLYTESGMIKLSKDSKAIQKSANDDRIARGATDDSSGNKESNFKMRNSNPMQYAEGVGSLLNYLESRKAKPRTIRSEQLTKLTSPKYYDESYLQTQLGKEANNVQQAALTTSGGSAASARAMTLAGMSNLNKVRSDAYFKMDEVNQGVYDRDQSESQRIADSNVNIRNQDYQATLQEEDYVQGRKELARDNLIKSVGNYGREQNDKNLIYNLTGGYNTDGSYDPEGKRRDWSQNLQLFNSNRNRRENGGLLDAFDKATTKTEQELEIERLKKKYNG